LDAHATVKRGKVNSAPWRGRHCDQLHPETQELAVPAGCLLGFGIQADNAFLLNQVGPADRTSHFGVQPAAAATIDPEGRENAAQAIQHIGVFVADKGGCKGAAQHENDSRTAHEHEIVDRAQGNRRDEKCELDQYGNECVQRHRRPFQMAEKMVSGTVRKVLSRRIEKRLMPEKRVFWAIRPYCGSIVVLA
tara:strand:- start:688 stop:1263 length:576 start_codon:yes stop_codon:yes gene_type:complete